MISTEDGMVANNASSTKALVTVSIANTNNRPLLQRCLESLYQTCDTRTLDIYVVDNASRDDSVDMMKSLFPAVNIIAREDRGSYAENQNLILKHVETPYVWILNEDTVIGEGVLDEMLAVMRQNARVGIAGVTILNPDGSLQPTCMRFPSIHQYVLKRWFGWTWRFRKNDRIPFSGNLSAQAHRRAQYVDWVNGASRLVRREVIDGIGLLDECLPIFYEETDQARLAQATGWACFYSPRGHVWHVQGASRRDRPERERMQRVLREGTYYYFRKHHGLIAASIIQLSDALHERIVRGIRRGLSK